MFRNYKFRNLNILLILCIFGLSTLGIFVIGSADATNQSRQIMGLVLGVIVMAVMCLIDYDFLMRFYILFYILTVVLLGLVLLFGDKTSGATRWIDFGFVRFQPSEIGKIFLILFFAKIFNDHEEQVNTFKFFIIYAALSAVPLALIVEEPDLSTTIVTFLIICAMMFVAGIAYKWVILALGIAIPAIGVFFYLVTREGQTILDQYQGLRILAWLYPEKYPASSYQQQNSIMAIGSGQLIGKGLNNESFDSVKNGNYISEPHTDFIYAVAGEELGFIGSVLIIVLLLIITIQCLIIGKKAKDNAGRLFCVGMASLVGFQSFVNICVVTGLMPNTGIPLPFVSYGLTSLITLYFGMGIVLNVGLQGKTIRKETY